MILCCGEALIDMIPAPTETGQTGYVPHCGGSVFNTAIALGRLGAPTGLLCGISNDLFGQQLTDSLKASYVDMSLLVRSNKPSTLAFVQIKDGQASYTFFDENSAGRMLTFDDMPKVSEDVTALYFGGISLACEPCADAYLALVKVNSDTKVIMLDPNIRPAFIDDIAHYKNRLNQMLGVADVVKVSDEDLNWIYPGPQSLVDKLQIVRSMGPKIVILTRGSKGSTAYFGNDAQVSVAAIAVDAIDTVGAGDTFNAGFLAKLSELGELHKDRLQDITIGSVEGALKFGARISAITVSRAGANPPWRREI